MLYLEVKNMTADKNYFNLQKHENYDKMETRMKKYKQLAIIDINRDIFTNKFLILTSK